MKKIPSPLNLKCNYIREPLGIDTVPLLSWELAHQDRSAMQVAYQILCSESLSTIQKNGGNIWDTGKVKSSESSNIVFQGKALKSGQRYYWVVKWWDNKGDVSNYSDIAFFETGLQDKNDWKGKWIGLDKYKKAVSIKSDVFKHTEAKVAVPVSFLLRKTIKITGPIKSARCYICGLGWYELFINGKKAGDRKLEPGQTDYDKTVLYSVYDVTADFKKGDNCIGVILANGRYIK